MKLLIVDDQSTVVQGLLHCTNWKAGWICWTGSGSEG